MTRNYDKRRTLDIIQPLLLRGMSGYEISKTTGIAGSYVYRLIRTLQLPKGNNCPHCGLDTKAHPALQQSSGTLRPEES